MTTTNYQLTDTAPKDVGGDKFLGWVNENGSSDTHFVLPRGIGKFAVDGGKIFGSLGIATHTDGSTLRANDVGVSLIGAYLSNQAACVVSTGQFGMVTANKYGSLMTDSIAKSPSLLTGSVNTIATASYLYGYSISGSNLSDADNVLFRNGLNTVLHHYFQAGTKTEHGNLPDGGIYFGESGGITVEMNINGSASVTLFMER